MATDTSEKGLESIIAKSLVEEAGYVQGNPSDFDREYAIDVTQLAAFVDATQPEIAASLNLAEASPRRTKFLQRLQGEIARHGVIHVLRKGVQDYPLNVDLFYGSPSPGNARAALLHAQNIFSITRQLRYSRNETQLSLDLALFINGLPVATFELKNSLTKQTVDDAVQQYKRDRDPAELLFHFGRCVVHFAVDDAEVRMCTELKGAASWFLPFNRGNNDGAGNPPNPDGIKTDYLWKQILTKTSLTDILENYAQIVETPRQGKKGKDRNQIFPRYHQLDVVRQLLAAARVDGVGKRYLIQHSAGSGKSNSIAWLVHQLVGLGPGQDADGAPLFDSVIVVTDRRNLDTQIRDTIRSFTQVASIVAHAEHSGDLRNFISEGKKIIITTVQKFPFVLDGIGDEHRSNKFAIVIDEAHSSQGGKTASGMNRALAESKARYDANNDEDEGESYEDQINAIISARRMLNNASYFAFTATPKNKTLEMFGVEYEEGGVIKHRPFHSYTMKQAIGEGFILDVLQNYTPVKSYYRLAKSARLAPEDDPEYDADKALKKMRKYVESHDHAIRTKAEIMVDHFEKQVIGRRKIGGQARAMVVCSGIARAIDYFHVISAYLVETKSRWQAIVAFSDFEDERGEKITEASLNGFPSSQIEDRIREDPYRFLVVADKYQTGYDEPLLHTMYVDKPLSGIRAVQTLSRLNRARPQKSDTFVLDFANDVDTIVAAFAPYYRTTVLSDETDPNKLHDLKADLDESQVYTHEQAEMVVQRFLDGASRDTLDPILDVCVQQYLEELDEDGQVDFKSKAKAFVRTYQFLASILPYGVRDWEVLSTFLNFLLPKLPAPKEEDLSKGVLESVDMESYRAEVKATLDISLPDDEVEIDPVPAGGGAWRPEPELETLSNILRTFNERFGKGPWKNGDQVERVISEDVPDILEKDVAYQNAIRNSDITSARLEFERAIGDALLSIIDDQTELYKQVEDNPGFRKEITDWLFEFTYRRGRKGMVG